MMAVDCSEFSNKQLLHVDTYYYHVEKTAVEKFYLHV